MRESKGRAREGRGEGNGIGQIVHIPGGAPYRCAPTHVASQIVWGFFCLMNETFKGINVL